MGKETSDEVATLASKILRDPKSSPTAKTLAASALSQADGDESREAGIGDDINANKPIKVQEIANVINDRMKYEFVIGQSTGYQIAVAIKQYLEG